MSDERYIIQTKNQDGKVVLSNAAAEIRRGQRFKFCINLSLNYFESGINFPLSFFYWRGEFGEGRVHVGKRTRDIFKQFED